MTSLRFLLPAVAVLAATIVAAGCGGAGSSEPVVTTHVSMARSYRFDPSSIEVKAGQTVTWTNDDNFTHTVEIEGRPDHKVDRGDSFAVRFAKPGTYHYTCTLHSHDMHGTVLVT